MVEPSNYEDDLRFLRHFSAEVFHAVCWMPTLRCPLKCGYCAARALPVDTHGKPSSELTPEQWIALWQAAPRPIEQVAITGGEPGVYAGLGQVLAAVTWPFTVDSNLTVDPRKWLPEVTWGRVKAVNAGLHFHPAHERAAEYWQRLKWLRDRLPETAQVVCCYVATQRELPAEAREIADRAAECGAEVRPLMLDDSFLYRERFPVRRGETAELCAQGAWYATVFPDSAVYRCTGHSYYAVNCMGKLNEGGWAIVPDKAYPCADILCTVCDPGRPPWVNRYSQETGMVIPDG